MNNTPQTHSQSPKNEQIIFDETFSLKIHFWEKRFQSSQKIMKTKDDFVRMIYMIFKKSVDNFAERESMKNTYMLQYNILFALWENLENSLDANATAIRVAMKYNQKAEKLMLFVADNGDGKKAKTT